MGGAEVPSTLLTDIAPAVIRVSNTTEHPLTTIQQCLLRIPILLYITTLQNHDVRLSEYTEYKRMHQDA